MEGPWRLAAFNYLSTPLLFRSSAARTLPTRLRTATFRMCASTKPPSALPYNHLEVEQKWQKYWEENKTFRTPEMDQLDSSKPKFYVLDMFPYPSGAGLHVGHPEGYTATDITARFKRMQGFNVMHPMGWDAFGLPAEQYALQTGTHPAVTTKKNVNRFREQLKSLGFSYDWDRELSTTDPSYYKWTQWIFLQLFNKGLAYQSNVPVNWCPELGTVLANEEVVDGVSERGGFPVERRPMKQWVLKITEYAERLLDDLEDLDWPESIKEMQRNWIGKSEGAQLTFQIDGDQPAVTVFTTRPETVCGVSYLCLAPEYEGLDELVSDEQKGAVSSYCEKASRKSDRERTGGGDGPMKAPEKTGVNTGAFAVNPINGEKVPIWVADYVLGGYGTGAVMAVPAHDQRDFEFATQYSLPIKPVVEGFTGEKAFENSGPICGWKKAAEIDLDGVDSGTARSQLLEHLEAKELGVRKVNYKLRDWLFSRQRYWGEPFPIIFTEEGEAFGVQESELPLVLPEVSSYKPSGTGESPLATVPDWVATTDPATGKPALRETNTMPQWAGSCWYYLRFLDPDNVGAPIDPAIEKYWMPVDLYVGGVEHAVLHLLYARFWHKVLYDCGVVTSEEPFQRLVNQGMILGEVEYSGYRRKEDAAWVSAEKVGRDESVEELDVVNLEPASVTKEKDNMVLKEDPSIRVGARAHKMSKSRGNVVNPDSVVEEFGGDALRCYLMFMGPLEQVKPWNTQGTQGMARFLSRVWRLAIDESGELSSRLRTEQDDSGNKEELKALHAVIKRVTEDTEHLRFNTAIAGMTEFVNTATKWESRSTAVLLEFTKLLSPYAPHIAEELWSRLGGDGAVSTAPWPILDESLLVEDTKLIIVQVNGKVRDKLQVPANAEKEAVMSIAKDSETVQKFMSGKTLRKEIYVPNKLVNLVVS